MATPTKTLSICEEMVLEILKELPAKSLSRFKCVSKEWLRIIEDPYFVNCHRARSHNRFGGIGLLSGHNSRNPVKSCFFLLDAEGNLQTASIPPPENFPVDLDLVSSAEALVCFGNRIWNPSTRDTMDLPPVKEGLNYKYLLGFDVFTNKYKVLCCCTIRNLANQAVQVLQVLTLGENSWKQIDFNQEQLGEDFEILSSRSFNNMIFCLISFGTKLRFCGIMTFDVQREHVGFISSPYKIRLNDSIPIHLGEIQGCLAFQDGFRRRPWILNHQTALWMELELKFVVHGRQDSSFFDGHHYIDADVIPICTIHTDEILFQYDDDTRRKHFKYLFYDLKTEKIRCVPQLVNPITWKYMIKYVDSVVRLKPPN